MRYEYVGFTFITLEDRVFVLLELCPFYMELSN